MRMTFDAKTPLLEQQMRAAGRKKVGRKHNHKIGPGKTALAAQRKRKFAATKRAIRWKRFQDAVRAYWLGERDTYPEKP